MKTRRLYSSDASVYQELPVAVAFPKTEQDIGLLIALANETGQSLIPRTAGTSLAGQVVGKGIIVDVSRHLNLILNINRDQKTVRVQPGVIRNELNMALKPEGLFFAPETSTANRAMIGGMLGNNSCGANSIVYGSTRDKVLAVRGYLSDGSLVTFTGTTPAELNEICGSDRTDLEARIYRELRSILQDPVNRREIESQFPMPSVTRRNTGYALDWLMNTAPFGNAHQPFNVSGLIAGSEGTLFFATEIMLRCDELPPANSVAVCAHFETVDQSLRANIIAMKYAPTASELIDRLVIAGARRNRIQAQNANFIVGDPAAILIVELRGQEEAELQHSIQQMIDEMRECSLGYAFPVFSGNEAEPLWELRKAGLGVVANCVGDDKPVTVIEDTAVAVHLLPAYIRELNHLLKTKFDIECVNYGHAGGGELHLRPMLNLKTRQGLSHFREIAQQVAELVKKYGGSLSGEHGDGRLRGEFIEHMVGSHNYRLFKQIKSLFDPNNILNPGKIVDAPPMDQNLRTEQYVNPHPPTLFRYPETGNVLGTVEMCSGSGDCRKTHLSGGTMCPSYMATRNEEDSTRARANILRHALTDVGELKPFARRDVYEVLDLCLSCKACKSECPSNVDIAKVKAEFLQGYYDAHRIPLRSRIIASVERIHRCNSAFPAVYNFLSRNMLSAGVLKWLVGFHRKRSLPAMHKTTLRAWFRNHTPDPRAGSVGHVFLFADEFTNYLDVPVGIATVELLERLGYRVEIPQHLESGRAAISKGLLRKAKKIATKNVKLLHDLGPPERRLVGIEPSALLTLRDEYKDLVPWDLKAEAQTLANRALLLDEFLDHEMQAGKLDSSMFIDESRTIRLHGHCHQKALASMASTIRILQLPKNYRVKMIPAGCCGMAGSFGYEKEHYDVSMKIGELVLFPTIRQEPTASLIAAPGTSCRHQIWDGTRREAQHPAQILRAALRD
ncbi:MAG TPA: FAD-linked oxidase C-terminal domain-containing protein [Pirellulaceae bacterium]|nr:FAD-linked oxidase C-terminal domain-containing protein [Pirellulaceae bacterium]